MYNGPTTAANRATWLARIGVHTNWASSNGGIGSGGFDFNTPVGTLPGPGGTLPVASPNSNPTITVGNLSYTEGDNSGNPVVIDAAATASDSDGDADWNGGKLEVQITANNEAADEISIAAAGSVAVAGSNVTHGGTTVGTISETSGTANDGIVTNGAKLTINFNGNATNAIIQDVVRAIAYRSTSANPSELSRTVTFTATDTNSGVGNDTSTISVTNLPDTTVTLVGGTLTITDVDGGNSNDQLEISFAASTYTITDTGGLLIDASSVAGSTGSGTSTRDSAAGIRLTH